MKIHQNPFKINEFHKISTASTTGILACLSRRIYFHQKIVPEMEFSDKADIENDQVCCPTSSGLRDRVAGRSSEIGQICSYLVFSNVVFIFAKR